ncbi:unnamed protein product [Cylicocyclus nassatus]|uniref:TATA-box-binding protein n=1 Tax=Cylicocyclus nassatus TaxID=53992 RepID=A0AA36GVC8_CYLNA|nr:unnamed protein product [Cylicocyclus nassatus]
MENGRNGTLSNGHHEGEEADMTEVHSADNGDEQDLESGSDDGSEPEQDDANNDAGDAEYELNREEPESPSAHDWKLILMKAEFAEELCEQIRKMKPYERCKRTGRVVPTKSLRCLIEGFFLFLDCGSKIAFKVMKNLTKDVFARCDLLFEISRIFPDQVLSFKQDNVSTWFNVFHFVKFVPDPRVSVTPRVFSVVHHPLQAHKKKKLIRMFQENWIALLRCTVPPKLLSLLIPYVTENVLDKLDEPHKTADFFFKAFDKGDMFAILSLGAIFKLIVAHNFEYPNFYDHVYSLTKPSVLYLEQKEKFITLLDQFLSSTHIPNYVVAGFAKRLSRMLLLAPLDAQEPVLGLIRNLMTRHPNVACLIHRDVPGGVICTLPLSIAVHSIMINSSSIIGPNLAVPMTPLNFEQQSYRDTNHMPASNLPAAMMPATPASAIDIPMPTLQNIVSTVNLGVPLDLKKIALHARNAEYNPKRFAAVIMRIREPRTTALIFSSGKMVCTGAKSEDASRLAARKYARIVQKLGFDAKFTEFKVQNMVGSCDVRFPIQLEGLCVTHTQFSTYEPELFPGLIYRMVKPRVVLLIFVSGKVVITGAKFKKDIDDAFSQIYPILKGFKK